MGWLPTILSFAEVQEEKDTLPLLCCPAYDFQNNCFLKKDGAFYDVTGNEALKVWIYFALLTERYRYLANSDDYGSEIHSVLGFPFSNGAKREEVKRYVTEALMVCPYITSIQNIDMQLDESVLYVRVEVESIYKERWVEVVVQF